MEYKAVRELVKTEVRYLDADTEDEALISLEWEDAGSDSAYFTTEYTNWRIEEDK